MPKLKKPEGNESRVRKHLRQAWMQCAIWTSPNFSFRHLEPSSWCVPNHKHVYSTFVFMIQPINLRPGHQDLAWLAPDAAVYHRNAGFCTNSWKAASTGAFVVLLLWERREGGRYSSEKMMQRLKGWVAVGGYGPWPSSFDEWPINLQY